MVNVKIERVIKDVPLPQYQTSSSACCDLHAGESILLKKGEFKTVRTGLRVFLPESYEGHIRSRSGLAINHGIVVLHGMGTLDADYRGELKVLLINHGPDDFIISKGDRIAQFIVNPFEQVNWDESPLEEERQETERLGGFGSTGI